MNLKILLLACFILLFSGTIFAAAPVPPHQFYGTVSIGGSPAANGIPIIAKITGTMVASTVTSNGRYGYDPVFFVYDPNGDRAGKKIEFYILEIKVGEQTFINGGITQLNFTIANAVCSDTFCDPNEETCSSCSQDCGNCPPSDTGGGGGGGGGDGGGGGGSPPCTPTWECTDWGECTLEGKQSRTCVKSNKCSSNTGKPIEVQLCTYVPPEPVKETEETASGTGNENGTTGVNIPSNDTGNKSTSANYIATGFFGLPQLWSNLLIAAIVIIVIIAIIAFALIARKKKK
ncbi:MAG: hypothetical protein AB1467_03260 [Candidatus Diapherotrites archaeon]